MELELQDYLFKVKNYLINLEYDIVQEDKEETYFVIRNEERGISSLMLDIEDPILIMEQYLFDLESPSAEDLIELLKINRWLVHGALVLDDSGKKLLFRDTLQLENLDSNELEASINALEVLMAEFSGELLKIAGKN